ncbi:orotidine-5'-phosphate decarboxylase [Planctomonas psychrotolerans]|uniref:orotidine-5'-phosphate decarboxylase n=1 Tax=Planctomonas psychrotolerans TaxID=2528712 RepID=UPI001D0D36F8|nr:orotidine-5'-phosphate decarboxylase [Planctomonas psychrotolerans]
MTATPAPADSRPFGARLGDVFAEHGHLCVGIDPHEFLLRDWGLPVSAAGTRDFGLRVVDAAAGTVGIVKPQVAFFERFGSAGYAALEDVLAAARAAGLLVIADAKRGDIGTSVDAYAAAWLTPGSPLESDALTVSPYLGVGALASTFALAASAGKGAFVLSATSNADAAAVQRNGVAAGVLAAVRAWNAARTAPDGAAPVPFGAVGVVLGATVDLAAFGIDTDEENALPGTPVLAPGYGSQGATFDTVHSTYGGLARGTILSESRSILSAGPDSLDRTLSRRALEAREVFA